MNSIRHINHQGKRGIENQFWFHKNFKIFKYFPDVESHSDDCDDDVKQVGALVHVSMNEASPWAPGYNVVGDKLQRNIFTNRVEQKSVTTACGNNLGKHFAF